MASDSDSDEDFFPVPKNFGTIIEEVNYNDCDNVELDRDAAVFVNLAIDCIVSREMTLVKRLSEHVDACKDKLTPTSLTAYAHLCHLINLLLSGDYLTLVTTACEAALSYAQLMAHTRMDELGRLKQYILTTVASTTAGSSMGVQLRLLESMVIGQAYMELFCQMNYTGPELSPSLLTRFLSDPTVARPSAERVTAPAAAPPVPLLGEWGGAAREVVYLNDEELQKEQKRFHASCISALEVDGEYPYSLVEIPVCLVLARVILNSLASPECCLWGKGVQFKTASSAVVSTGGDMADGESESVYSRVTSEGLIAYLSRVTLPDGGSLPMDNVQTLKKSLTRIAAPLAWISARAVVTHLRLIMYTAPSNVSSGKSEGGKGATSVTIEKVPSLWCEAQDLFGVVLPTFGNLCGLNHECSTSNQPVVYAASSTDDSSGDYTGFYPETSAVFSLDYSAPQARLLKQTTEVQCWLEYGLLMFYFNTQRQGKRYFGYAQKSAQLTVSLTGALGKKTKYQKDDFAQLYVHTESELMYLAVANEHVGEATAGQNQKHGATVAAELTPSTTPSVAPIGETDVATSGALRFEIGKHIVRDNASGEEVAVREVTFGSVAEGASIGGYDDNIYFDDGTHYSEDMSKFRTSTATGVAQGKSEGLMKEAALRGLHYVDEAVVLALCLDVANSNPSDGLTNEEMIPYVQCILNRAIADKKKKKSVEAGEAVVVPAPPNWMIYSTALLQRSWIEFEKGRTMDRAMLQIQALIDQHSTKLTVMQPTHEAAVEQSAPVQDRMRYLFSIVYPPQYELKAELAQRYLTCGVFNSALGYFKELQMWDDVVACYQLLEKPHRAEMVVRERLACTDGSGGETPYMLTALGDITMKPEYYERAWELSGKRYARAKRTLGRMCFDKGKFPEAIAHFADALSVQPATANIWYMKGVACMRIEDFDMAIEAFVRCNNQQSKEDEFAEAYSNLGAIYVQRQMYSKAYAAFADALRLSADNWKIVENLMITTLVLGRRVDCIQFMQKLLDLRLKSHRPVHVEELHRLSYLICCDQVAQWRRDADPATAAASTANYIDNSPALTAGEKLWAATIDCSNPNRSSRSLGTETKKLINLIYNITNAIKSSSQVWGIFAEVMDTLGYYSMSVNFRMKQMRAYLVEYSEIYQHRVGGSEAKTVDEFFEHCVNAVENMVLTLQRLLAGNATLEKPSGDAARLVEECKSLLRSVVLKFQTQIAPAAGATLPTPPTDPAIPPNPKQVRFGNDVLEQTQPASVFCAEDANKYIATMVAEIAKLD